jgi:4-amino-4-deoxychorismate lyase
MILVNGADDGSVSALDRGLHYGDGLFETIEIQDGHPVFWRRHLRRLEYGCQRMHIPFPGTALLTAEAQRLCHGAFKGVLKIILTRGPGGRGYRHPDQIETTRLLTLHPFPEYHESLQKDGIVARFCAIRLGLNPALAGIKHLNRLEQVMARAEWRDQGIHEGLMLDIDGHVVEGTMSNLFIVKNGTMYTDPLKHCGVAGIVREIILEACSAHAMAAVQAPLSKDEFAAAEEVFVTNSLIGIWPVRAIEDYRFNIDGQVLRQVRRWLDAYRQEDLRDAA